MVVSVEEICRLVAIQLGVRSVGPGDRLMADLGAESVDLVNIVAALEDRYQLEIDESEVPDLLTVADLHRCVEAKLGR